MSIGKRTGGDILLRDPKPMDFWGPISRDYHGRYVPLSMVLEGGVPRALDEDEALALYVTGGSKSGAAFCVSVHHWRRYPGSDAPPSAGAFEPMDHDHWYDTFNPCCVLHVRAS